MLRSCSTMSSNIHHHTSKLCFLIQPCLSLRMKTFFVSVKVLVSSNFNQRLMGLKAMCHSESGDHRDVAFKIHKDGHDRKAENKAMVSACFRSFILTFRKIRDRYSERYQECKYLIRAWMITMFSFEAVKKSLHQHSSSFRCRIIAFVFFTPHYYRTMFCYERACPSLMTRSTVARAPISWVGCNGDPTSLNIFVSTGNCFGPIVSCDSCNPSFGSVVTFPCNDNEECRSHLVQEYNKIASIRPNQINVVTPKDTIL